MYKKYLSIFSITIYFFLFSSLASAEYIRKNASTQAAADDIKALNKALKMMKAMGCNDPLSWYYQGATHSVPNKVSPNPLCPTYNSLDDLLWGWKTCTHQDGSEIHFLIWHRLYIAHFEKIVRKLSGKNDFALPYWNYIYPNNRVMPESFRTPELALYEASRLPGLNQGEAIASFMNDNLDVRNLMRNRVFSVFNQSMDRAPHGAMHVYIGGGYAGNRMWNPIFNNSNKFGLMNQVESAGFDPIFWLHHANIDFLWQAWDSSSFGTRPSLAELQAVPWPYKFFDADGNKKEYTIEEVYHAAFNLDYRYDVLAMTPELKSNIHQEKVATHLAQSKELVWSRKVEKSSDEKIVSLTPEQFSSNKKFELFVTTPSNAVVLEVSVSFKSEPKTFYNVYIVNSKGEKTLVGVMTFFGLEYHANHHENHNGELQKSFSYDVTSDLPYNGDYTISIENQLDKKEVMTVKNISLYKY